MNAAGRAFVEVVRTPVICQETKTGVHFAILTEAVKQTKKELEN